MPFSYGCFYNKEFEKELKEFAKEHKKELAYISKIQREEVKRHTIVVDEPWGEKVIWLRVNYLIREETHYPNCIEIRKGYVATVGGFVYSSELVIDAPEHIEKEIERFKNSCVEGIFPQLLKKLPDGWTLKEFKMPYNDWKLWAIDKRIPNKYVDSALNMLKQSDAVLLPHKDDDI